MLTVANFRRAVKVPRELSCLPLPKIVHDLYLTYDIISAYRSLHL